MHFEIALVELGTENFCCAAVIKGNQRFFSISVNRDHTIVGLANKTSQVANKFGGYKRRIDADDKIPIGRRSEQAGVDSPGRSAAGSFVGDKFHTVRKWVENICAYQQVIKNWREQIDGVLQQRFTVPLHKGFVGSHARAAAAGQYNG